MKTSLRCFSLALGLVLGVNVSAHAWPIFPPPPPHQPPTPPKTAPEIDPSLALGGITLLTGTLTVLRAQRRK